MEETLMLIRPATIEDIPAIYRLLDALRLESVWATIPVEPNQAYVCAQLIQVIYDARQRVLVAELASNFPALHGELVGVCHALLTHHDLLPDLSYVAEKALYVTPECRALGIGKKLWCEVVRWGKAHGAYGSCYGRIATRHNRYAVEEVIWRVFEKESLYA